MRDIRRKEINEAQKRAATRAIRLNKALGLSYYEVKDGKIFEIFPDGSERFVKKPLFGLRKVEKKRYTLKHDD